MIRRSDITTYADGTTPQPGVYVTVKNAATGLLASIYDDSGTLISGSRLLSDSGGVFSYNADAGEYLEEFRLSELEQPRKVYAQTLGGIATDIATDLGFITWQQFGAKFDGTTNDQPAMTSAIAYAVAHGIERIESAGGSAVRLHTPLRTTPTWGYETDGVPIVIQGAKRLTLDFGGAVIDLRGPTGNVDRGIGQPSLDAGSGVKPWLGGFIYIVGSDTCEYIEIANVGINGNFTCGDWKNNSNANLSDKAIRIQDTHADKVVLRDVYAHHFAAEIAYLAGAKATDNTPIDYDVQDCRFEYSPQSCLNPNGAGRFYGRNIRMGHSYIGAEILGGDGFLIENSASYDCGQFSIIGGAGLTQRPVIYNYGFPNRDPAATPPWADIVDCTFDNVGTVYCPTYTRITGFRSTDTVFEINAGQIGAAGSVVLEGTYTFDQLNQTAIVTVTGPATTTTAVPGAGAGIYIADVADVSARIGVRRTQNAKTNGYHAAAFRIQGRFVADSNVLTLDEGDGILQISTFGGAVVNMPTVVQNTPTTSHTIGAGTPYGLTSVDCAGAALALTITSPSMAVNNSGSAGAYAVTIGAGSGFDFGQRVRIGWNPYSTAGTTYTFAKNGTGMRLNADAVLATRTDYLILEWDTAVSVWVEVSRSIKA